MPRKKPDKDTSEETGDKWTERSKTVKTYLDTHLTWNRCAETATTTKSYIEQTVKVLSPLAQRGAYLFNAAILKACASGESFVLEENEVQTLYYQSCRMDREASCVKKKKDFTNWMQKAYEDAPEAYDRLAPSEGELKVLNGSYFSQILASHAKNYRTNFLNNLSVPIERRVASYIKGYWTIQEPTMAWSSQKMSSAMKLFFQGETKEAAAKEVLPERVVEWLWNERHVLTVDKTIVLNRIWIEKNLVPTLRFHYRMLAFWDSVKTEYRDRIRIKSFTLAPLHQTKRLFISIDSTAFFHLLKAIGKLPSRPSSSSNTHRAEKERELAAERYKKERVVEWEKKKDEWDAKFRAKNGKDPVQEDYPKAFKEPPKFQRIRLPKDAVSEESWTDFEWFQRKDQDQSWRKLFHLEEPTTNQATTQWKFANHITTDGVSLCLLYTRREKAKSEPADIHQANLAEQVRGKRAWYVDPGRTHIVTAMRFAGDSTGVPEVEEERRYSRRQYYEDGGIFWANETRRVWNTSWMKDEKVIEFHKSHTFRTASYELWKRALTEYSQVYETIWDETSQPRHSWLSMQTYQGKQSALMRFWNSLSSSSDERSNTVVVYGVCYRTMACGGKGEVSVPVKIAHKTCKLCYTVYDLDEFRTSKLCALCGNDLEILYCRRTNHSAVTTEKVNMKIHKEVRGLRCCRNPLCIRQRHTAYVDRDLNACWNFWSLCRKEQRPTHFSRAQQ